VDARQGSESEWSESEWLESLFTSTLNKITKKIGRKHRTPSKKNLECQKCSNVGHFDVFQYDPLLGKLSRLVELSAVTG
jgi:hypothetical protein